MPQIPRYTVRPASERGSANYGWLQARYTFSFGDYHHPDHQGFRTLRVINEDIIAPGKGFETHPHRDMEIISVPLAGAIAHKDSLGNIRTIRAGETQYMSAGTGVTHSEFNPSDREPCHLIQIWIMPQKRGRTPRYQEGVLPSPESPGLHCIAAPESALPSTETAMVFPLYQDAFVYHGYVRPGVPQTFQPRADRGVWIQVLSGSMQAGSTELTAGDGLAIEGESSLIPFRSDGEGRFLLFDLG